MRIHRGPKSDVASNSCCARGYLTGKIKKINDTPLKLQRIPGIKCCFDTESDIAAGCQRVAPPVVRRTPGHGAAVIRHRTCEQTARCSRTLDAATMINYYSHHKLDCCVLQNYYLCELHENNNYYFTIPCILSRRPE